jgi:hypothetical protein
LLGGRPELLSELPAIYDSPILGHGSWSKDPIYLIEEHQALKLLGYGEEAKLLFRDELRQGFIPAHSYFFQAWVDAGILGAVFWGWMFILTARVMLRVYPAAALLLPVVSYLGFYLLWNIPFSPYGTAPRLTFPYSIVMMIAFMDMARRTATQPATAKIKMKAAPAPGRRRSAGARSQAGSNGPPRVKLAPVEGMVDPQ